jgi:glycosyltransferase involved in cell wall biosynthesis
VRILFWTELYWPHIGGIEVKSHHLALALQARGHEVAVITSHGSLALPDRANHDGIEIRRYPFLEALAGKRLDLLAVARKGVQEFKRDFRPDLTQVFFTDPSVIFHWMTQSASKAPTIVAVPIALDGLRSGDGTLLMRTLKQASWIVATSHAMLSDVIALAPEVEQRCSVIHNSLDPPKLPSSPLPFNPPVLLCVGRVVREKGFDLAIQSLPEILRKFPSARLRIAGDGPLRADLRDDAAALGIAKSVEFLGWVDPVEVPRWIDRSTLVLVPSRWREAFGNIALQAMQMGRPVVAAATGGLPEVVDHEGTGLLTPVEDAAALSRAVLRLLGDHGLAKRLGYAGKLAAATRFSFDDYVGQHELLYAKLTT